MLIRSVVKFSALNCPRINFRKVGNYAPANFPVDHHLLSDIPVTSDGFTVLGSPLGPAEYRLETALGRIQKVKDSLHGLGDLEDSQLEAALLRSCLSLPKDTHLLRTCPPDVIQRALEWLDEIMREAVSDLAGCPLSDWAWLKSSLPSSLVNLNIRHAIYPLCPCSLYWLHSPVRVPRLRYFGSPR